MYAKDRPNIYCYRQHSQEHLSLSLPITFHYKTLFSVTYYFARLGPFRLRFFHAKSLPEADIFFFFFNFLESFC